MRCRLSSWLGQTRCKFGIYLRLVKNGGGNGSGPRLSDGHQRPGGVGQDKIKGV